MPPVDEAAPPPSPGEPPIEMLRPFERAAFRFIDRLIRRHIPHTEIYNKSLGLGYIVAGSGRMVKVRGLERLARLTPHDGILLVSNHRSFFDLYMLMAALYRYTSLQQPLVCPVRGNFFYERPLGIVVNLLASGGRMYPPFFRETERQRWNQWALLRTVELLRGGRILVGFHPEGTRNKNPDPYAPLPAQPGVGKLVFESRSAGRWPIVVPAFIQGMSQDFFGDIKANFTGERHAVAVFGEPIDLSRFDGMSNRLATHKRIADYLLATIYALGDEEKVARAEYEKNGWR
jgi:1-acyl-sn-glycerol-3-phosphate acyltransferase